jgi:30S ribosomal protein S31
LPVKISSISEIAMGRGDKRTRRGKIFKSSYGNTRPKTTNKTSAGESKGSATGAAVKKAPVAKKSKTA